MKISLKFMCEGMWNSLKKFPGTITGTIMWDIEDIILYIKKHKNENK